MSLPCRAGSVVYSRQELTQSPNMLPSCMIILALSSDRMSEMKNGSFSGMDLLGGPPRSILLLQAMLVSMVLVAAPGHVEAQGSCGCLWSRLPLMVRMMSEAHPQEVR